MKNIIIALSLLLFIGCSNNCDFIGPDYNIEVIDGALTEEMLIIDYFIIKVPYEFDSIISTEIYSEYLDAFFIGNFARNIGDRNIIMIKQSQYVDIGCRYSITVSVKNH